MIRRSGHKSQQVHYSWRHVSEPELVRRLKLLGKALTNSAFDGILDAGRALILTRRCYSCAGKIARLGRWEYLPIGNVMVETFNPRRRKRLLPEAYGLIEECLDFIQTAIDEHADRLDADESLASRVAGVAEVLNLPAPTGDDP